jgi:hypothetical protein
MLKYNITSVTITQKKIQVLKNASKYTFFHGNYDTWWQGTTADRDTYWKNQNSLQPIRGTLLTHCVTVSSIIIIIWLNGEPYRMPKILFQYIGELQFISNYHCSHTKPEESVLTMEDTFQFSMQGFVK